jgi:hypothetical protein
VVALVLLGVFVMLAVGAGAVWYFFGARILRG